MIDLDRELDLLSTRLEWPDPPDVTSAVNARLRPVRSIRPVLVVAVTLVLLLVAIPTTRDRVAAFFGIGGVNIEKGALLDPGVAAELGDLVDLASLTTPLPAALGRPDFARRDLEGRLWVVYESRDRRPAALLTVFDTVLVPGLTKLVADPSLQVEQVAVNGEPAFWVAGGQHFILFERSDGSIVEDRGRLSEPALIWVSADTTYRLEAHVSRDRAVEIAESTP